MEIRKTNSGVENEMKKIIIIMGICVLIAGMTTASAAPGLLSVFQTPDDIEWDGTFSGNTGYYDGEDWVEVAAIQGNFKEAENRPIGFFQGTVAGPNNTGNIAGFYGRHLVLGRVSNDEGGKLPIIGFIGFNTTSQQFAGRWMSLIGPALYFGGNYVYNE